MMRLRRRSLLLWPTRKLGRSALSKNGMLSVVGSGSAWKMLGARHCRCPNTIGWPETPCLRCALKLEYAARLRLVELLVLLRLIHHIDVDELDFRIPLSQQGFEGVFELQVVDVDSDYGTATAGRGVHLFVSPRLDIPQVKVVEILAVSGRAQDAVGAF